MKKLLFIEDNSDIRETTALLLQMAGYKVLTAENGRTGVELALAEHPDLILCDIIMPVLDGFGVLHLLSKNESTAGIPFIFLTAKTERSDYRQAMDKGANDYITKPFYVTELLNAIESRLKKADQIKEYADPASPVHIDFADVTDVDCLKKILEGRETTVFQKKDILYGNGSFPKDVFYIISGNVKIYRINEEGKELITGLCKKGDFLGYLSLLENRPYDDYAVAMEKVEVVVVPYEDMALLLYKNIIVSREFLQMVSNNLREKEEQLLRLAYSSVRKRVAEALIKINSHFTGGQAFDSAQKMEILREDLANIAGAATESTIRTLSDLKQEGLIAVDGSHITILQYDQLSHLEK